MISTLVAHKTVKHCNLLCAQGIGWTLVPTAEVVRQLSVVEELEAVVTTNLQRATRLRQSILQRAFERKL